METRVALVMVGPSSWLNAGCPDDLSSHLMYLVWQPLDLTFIYIYTYPYSKGKSIVRKKYIYILNTYVPYEVGILPGAIHAQFTHLRHL